MRKPTGKGIAPRRWERSTPRAPALVPSLLAAPALRLHEAIDATASADALHIDVMDGHFVPNLAFTPAQTRAIAHATTVPLDVHLMMTKPLSWLDAFCEAGAFGITVHAEAVEDVRGAVRAIAERGCAAGISVRAETNIEKTLERVGDALDCLSMVLVMSVAPGFGGQSFHEGALENVERAARIKQQQHLSYRIEIDGGITHETAPRALSAGAEALVIGTALFSQSQPRATLEQWRSRYGEAEAAR